MRPLEQMTAEQVMQGSVSMGDVAIYGGLIAIGFGLGAYIWMRYARR